MSFEQTSFESLFIIPQKNGLNKPKRVRGEGLPMVNMGEIFANRRIKNIDMDLVPLLEKELNCALEDDDLLFARQSLVPSGAGKCSIFLGNSEKTVFESHLIRCRLDKKKADPTYYFYFFESPAGKDLISTIVEQGAGVAGIRSSDLAKLQVPCPPLSVQMSTAKLLGALDDRIDLLKQTNQTLEAIAQTIFKSWFVNFDPVHAKQQGIACAGIDAETAELFPDSFEDSELGQIPKGWRCAVLGNYISKLTTGRRPKGGIGAVIKGVPSIGAESVVKIGDFDFSKTKYITREFYEAMRSGKAQSHDVLLYKDGGQPGVFLPRVSMFGDEFPFKEYAINEHVFQIRVSSPYSQAFLYFYLWSDLAMHELKNRGGKAAIPGINQQDVKELPLLVPNIEVLARFDQVSAPLISKIFDNSKQVRSLALLRDTLLPRLISGKLDVSAIDAQLEEIA
jgi:type I restriction enzyme S subunit